MQGFGRICTFLTEEDYMLYIKVHRPKKLELADYRGRSYRENAVQETTKRRGLYTYSMSNNTDILRGY